KLHCIAAIADNQLFKFGPENINEGLQLLSRANRLIGHNIINHDLPIMSKLYNWSPEAHTEVFDTLIVSRLINPDRKAPEGYQGKAVHSIEAYGHQFGRHKPSHEDWDVFTPEMLHRCSEDTKINKLVYEYLQKDGYHGQPKSAIALELTVAKIITQQ